MLLSSKNNSGTRLNIQMTRPDQEISQINPKSRINPESRVNPEIWFNPDSQINLDSRINYPIRINSPIQPTFKTPLTRQTETLHWHDQRKFIIKISKWFDQTKMSVESILEVESILGVKSILGVESILRGDSTIRIASITKWQIAYVPLDPVDDYIHMLNLNTILRVGWKMLPNLKFSNLNFKLKVQTQTWASKK